MRKQYSFLVVLALLLSLTACQSATPAAKQTDPTNAPQPTTTIKENEPVIQTTPVTTEPATPLLTLEEAVSIALKDAGFTKEQVQDLDVELDRDTGAIHYDVDFEKGGKDYDYEIHAETGNILKKEVPPKTNQTTSTQKTQPISRDEAKNIALKHAGLSVSQVRDLEVELDRDDGKLHYDVDFEAGGYDYDYEIDATTGKILRSQKEKD